MPGSHLRVDSYWWTELNDLIHWKEELSCVACCSPLHAFSCHHIFLLLKQRISDLAIQVTWLHLTNISKSEDITAKQIINNKSEDTTAQQRHKKEQQIRKHSNKTTKPMQQQQQKKYNCKTKIHVKKSNNKINLKKKSTQMQNQKHKKPNTQQQSNEAKRNNKSRQKMQQQ